MDTVTSGLWGLLAEYPDATPATLTPAIPSGRRGTRGPGSGELGASGGVLFIGRLGVCW